MARNRANFFDGKPFFLPVSAVQDFRFVYFLSLIKDDGGPFSAVKRKTGYYAVEYISGAVERNGKEILQEGNNSVESGLNQIFQKYQDIINWLGMIAESERNKEVAFLRAMSSHLPDNSYLKNLIKSPSILNDPSHFNEFIIAFNSINEDLKSLEQRIIAERDRLSKNRAEYERAGELLKKEGISRKQLTGDNILNSRGAASTSALSGSRYSADVKKAISIRYGGNYSRTYISQQANLMASLAKTLFSNTSSGMKNSYANVLKDFLLQRYSKEIAEHLTVTNQGVVADAGLQSLLYAITSIAMSTFFRQNAKTITEVFQSSSKSQSYESRMESLQTFMKSNEDLFGLQQLDQLMSDPVWRQNASTSVTQQLIKAQKEGMKLNKQTKRVRAAKKAKISKNLKGTDLKANEIEAIADALASSSFSVKQDVINADKGWVQDEIQTLVSNIFRGGNITSIGLAAGGSIQKTDSAQLVITTELDENKAIKQLERILEANLRKNEDLSNLSTADDSNDESVALRQKEILDEMIANYNKILNDLQKQRTGVQGFLVSYSNKIYESLGRATKSFSGGQVGSTLNGYLDKIERILSVSGGVLDNYDMNWLTNALINCNRATVMGTSQKDPLEQYLSALTVNLLFDDYAAFTDIGPQIDQTAIASSMSDITTLHVFSLQGIVNVPISYILFQLRDDLQKKYEILLQEGNIKNSSQIVKATIHTSGFPGDESPYKNLTKETWESTAQAARDAIHIEVTFLGGFLDFLNKITNSFMPFNSSI